jgi:hypothetical protein
VGYSFCAPQRLVAVGWWGILRAHTHGFRARNRQKPLLRRCLGALVENARGVSAVALRRVVYLVVDVVFFFVCVAWKDDFTDAGIHALCVA